MKKPLTIMICVFIGLSTLSNAQPLDIVPDLIKLRDRIYIPFDSNETDSLIYDPEKLIKESKEIIQLLDKMSENAGIYTEQATIIDFKDQYKQIDDVLGDYKNGKVTRSNARNILLNITCQFDKPIFDLTFKMIIDLKYLLSSFLTIEKEENRDDLFIRFSFENNLETFKGEVKMFLDNPLILPYSK